MSRTGDGARLAVLAAAAWATAGADEVTVTGHRQNNLPYDLAVRELKGPNVWDPPRLIFTADSSSAGVDGCQAWITAGGDHYGVSLVHLPQNTPIEVPERDFSRSDGLRLSPSVWRIQELRVTCEQPQRLTFAFRF